MRVQPPVASLAVATVVHMRLASFRLRDSAADAHRDVSPGAGASPVRTGVVAGDEVVDLTDPQVGLPGRMIDLLEAGPEALAAAGRAAGTGAIRYPLAEVRLLAPVPRPPVVLAIALNYADHISELDRKRPEVPTFFTKLPTCVVGPGDPVEVPLVSDTVDYEGELALVIGRRCRHVPASAAPEVVAGFTILNDVSLREWQWRAPTFTIGKSFDTHGPMGPFLVTPDEVGDPHRLQVRTWVNDELRQDGNSADMLFSCWEQIEHLSTACTLEPGDVISTGTPAGVGASFDPPRWLRAGDTVRVAVEGVGELSNPVVDEPAGGRTS